MLSTPLSPLKGAFAFLALLLLAAPALAQTPFLPDEEKFGRPADQDNLSYCVDKRDPAWEVDAQIAEAIASALLLNPQPHYIEDQANRADLDQLYRQLLGDCRLFLGFKLIADVYPDWLTISHAYYQVSYVFVTADPSWTKLGDIPRDRALGPSLATSADFQLVAFLKAQPVDQRWPRYPMASDADALKAVMEGRVAAALVWAPSFYALKKSDPAMAALRVIASDPLPTEQLPVGAVMLSGDSFLRDSLDQAIAALTQDGTIAGILEKAGFPATVPAQ